MNKKSPDVKECQEILIFYCEDQKAESTKTNHEQQHIKQKRKFYNVFIKESNINYSQGYDSIKAEPK